MSEHRSNCRLCAARCGVVITTEGDRVVGVRGEPDHPLSEGYVCSKGRMLGLTHHDPRRFDRALIGRPPSRRVVPLDELLDDLAVRIDAVIARHGPDAVGVFHGTQAIQESGGAGSVLRLMSRLGSRSYYSIVTVDNIAKVVAGLKLTNGRHSLYPRSDFANATFVLAFGINQVVSHSQNATNPVVKLRGVAQRGEVWIVDPRRTEAAALATRHLQIRASADVFLVAHLVRELLRDGADLHYLEHHASGVDELRRAVEPHTRALTAARTGLAESQLTDLLAGIRNAKRIAVMSGTGTRMGPHPTLTEWLLFVLSIVTGSMDRIGGTILTGRGIEYAPEGSVAEAPGPRSRPELRSWAGQYPCAALADEIEAGNLKALVCFGGNPAGAVADGVRLSAALETLDVLAVHDIVPTETTDRATHVLPGTSELEDACLVGSLTPDGRRFMQYAPAIFAPQADRRATWWYVNELAERLGRSVFEQPVGEAEAHSARLGFANLDQVRGAPGSMVVGDVVQFGHITDDLDDERWNVAPPELIAQLDALEELPKLVLIPRRQSRHVNWTLTELVGPSGKVDTPDLLMHPDDAAVACVRDGDVVVAATAHGEVTVRAVVTADIARGAVSIPHGHRDVPVNRLTSTSVGVDPISGMILQSGVPIAVRPRSRPASQPVA